MKIIDLSMTIEEGMQTFAAHWHPFVEITQLGRHGIENRETRKITLGTHTGTHIDAPRHFLRNGETIDNVCLDVCYGDAVIIDFSNLPDSYEVSKKDLQLALRGRLADRLIFRFDWDRYLGTNKYYSDHPYLSEEACEYIVELGCKLIALDTPQPDNPKNGRHSVNDAPNHKILLGAGVLIVEYLVSISSISKDNVLLVVAPLKIKDGDGAPVRCFAIEN